TVFHPGDFTTNQKCLFEIQTVTVRSLFSMNYRRLPDLKSFNVVVIMQNIRVINLWLLTLHPLRSFKLVHWGIGTSSENGLSLKRTMVSKCRNFLARFASAQILYSEFPLPLFDHEVVKRTFIANNTVSNPH